MQQNHKSTLFNYTREFTVSIFTGFRSTGGGRNFRFPIDFLVIVTTVLTLPRSL